VVNMKTPSASRGRRSTDSALSLLSFQQSVELSGGESVRGLASVVCMSFWVSVAVFLMLCRNVFKVVQAPIVVARVTARLAVHLVAVNSALGLVEFRKSLYCFASRAQLRAGREVKWLSAWHEYSFVEYSYTRNTLYARGT
jgi:hypothetical protein